MKKKVVAYARVSTELDSQENSLQSQKAYFENFIKSHEDWEFAGIFADEGTGVNTKNRKQFNQMIQKAENGEINIILAKELSRFSRNIIDTIQNTRMLKSIGVEVCFLLDGISTMDSDSELKLRNYVNTRSRRSP